MEKCAHHIIIVRLFVRAERDTQSAVIGGISAFICHPRMAFHELIIKFIAALSFEEQLMNIELQF